MKHYHHKTTNKLGRKLSKLIIGLVVLFTIGAVAAPAYAAKGDQGTDWSVYQGANGKWGRSDDKFSISQVGGYYNGSFVDQWTYPTQVKSTIAMGRRAHTYIYAQFSGRWQADQMLNHYLPMVQTPKGSIVMLDVESGSPDTDSVLYALQRVQNAGYTAVLYGYKNFLVNHVDLHRIAKQFPLALAEYPDYNITLRPNYNWFPSFENIGIFQFTSTYAAGGLDGDVDLTGITDNGYSNGNAQKPKSNTPAVDQGKQLHQATHNYTVQSGDSWWKIAHDHGMDMYTLAQLNGRTINSMLYPGQVLRVADEGKSGHVNNVVNRPVQQPQASSWRDGLGDTWHTEHGTVTLNTWVNLRWGARTTSSRIATLGPGATIKYDAWSNHGGYTWVRQPRSNGQYAYLAVRNAYTHEPFGSFK